MELRYSCDGDFSSVIRLCDRLIGFMERRLTRLEVGLAILVVCTGISSNGAILSTKTVLMDEIIM